ncbi:MAG: hypothetical protein IPH48_16950 [bacterium]|nr:hypothetical protein [bacterium]
MHLREVREHRLVGSEVAQRIHRDEGEVDRARPQSRSCGGAGEVGQVGLEQARAGGPDDR